MLVGAEAAAEWAAFNDNMDQRWISYMGNWAGEIVAYFFIR